MLILLEVSQVSQYCGFYYVIFCSNNFTGKLNLHQRPSQKPLQPSNRNPKTTSDLTSWYLYHFVLLWWLFSALCNDYWCVCFIIHLQAQVSQTEALNLGLVDQGEISLWGSQIAFQRCSVTLIKWKILVSFSISSVIPSLSKDTGSLLLIYSI